MTLCLCSLLAATREFSIPIGQKMQLTGWDNGNEMRNATCVDSKTSIEWPYCLFPILCLRCASVLHCNCNVNLAKCALGSSELTRGAPDLEFSNPAGSGFTGFGQKFRPDLKQDILG